MWERFTNFLHAVGVVVTYNFSENAKISRIKSTQIIEPDIKPGHLLFFVVVPHINLDHVFNPPDFILKGRRGNAPRYACRPVNHRYTTKNLLLLFRIFLNMCQSVFQMLF